MIKDSNFVEKRASSFWEKNYLNRLPIFASRILIRLNWFKYLFTYPSKQTAESFFLSTTIDQNKVWQQIINRYSKQRTIGFVENEIPYGH